MNISYFSFAASYTMDDSGKFKTIVTFDCRGVEPVEFIPGPGWAVESEENGSFFHTLLLN